MYKIFKLSLIIFLLASSTVHAEKTYDHFTESGRTGHLTSEEIERLKECKRLMQDADETSFAEALATIEKSPYPHDSLQLLEAAAETYTEIVKEQNIIEQKRKEFLLTKINFNMAYLQLAGVDTEQQQDTALNKMIRWKLRQHILSSLKEHSPLFNPLE